MTDKPDGKRWRWALIASLAIAGGCTPKLTPEETSALESAKYAIWANPDFGEYSEFEKPQYDNATKSWKVRVRRKQNRARPVVIELEDDGTLIDISREK